MKRIWCHFFIILILAGPAYGGDALKMVYFDDFAPFCWKDGSGRMNGIYIDIIDEVIGKNMGLMVTHQGYPWKRAQLMVQKNKADGFLTKPTPRRKTYILASEEPIYRFDITLFTHRESKALPKLKKTGTLEELKPFHTVNYLGNGWAKQNLAHMDVDWVPTLAEALDLVSRNRYDLFLGASPTVQYHLNRLKHRDKIIEIPIVVDQVYIHLCISKNSPYAAILPEFDRKVRDLRRSGKLDLINKPYF